MPANPRSLRSVVVAAVMALSTPRARSADAYSRLTMSIARPHAQTRRRLPGEHAPQNVLADPDEIARFHDRCSDFMRELLEALAATPDQPRPFPQIEDGIGWPRRRIASVLGGVWRLRQREFAGRRPYRFHDTRQSASGRWEMWVDAGQAAAIRAAAANELIR